MTDDDNPVQINLKSSYAPEPNVEAVAAEFGNGSEFELFIDNLLSSVEDGTPVAHVIAHVVMTLFQPAFVIVGSPNTTRLPDGTVMPKSLGVVLGSDSPITRNDLIILLRNLSDKMEYEGNPERLLDNE